jgi:radical SAM family uncharacterized protein/radical SAM-linked protein
MSILTNEELLSLVNRPSRYLGNEINSIHKCPTEADLHMALAFPDLYEIGTSHLGLSILYDIINGNDRYSAERVFAPASDMEDLLRKTGESLKSLESRTPLKDFNIIGFSLMYELNYTNILLMLDLSNIPFLSQQRDDSCPFIIAGGPCACNPEPVADFFDAVVVGDGEQVIVDMCAAYIGWKDDGMGDRAALLHKWSEIQGVYVPSCYEAVFGSDTVCAVVPKTGGLKVKRAVVNDLDAASFPETPVVAWSKPVHDRLRLEISRGCTRGCRFCQAGMIYRPVRERSPERLLSLFNASLAKTGYADLSLLSLSTGDYSCISELMERLMGENNDHPIAVSLPSVRAETLTPALMDVIRRVRKTGFTIAPEAGSQRLRDIINKNLSEEDIVNAVTRALQMGWQGVKLYFMIGLPTETEEDISGIVSLVKKMRGIKTDNRRPYQISVSVATFIPKPHTPFQWARQLPLKEAREKIQWLKKELRISRVQFKWQDPEVSYIEGLFARGDRRLSGVLLKAYGLGCRFDGWSDSFNFDKWNQALVQTGIDIDDYTTRKRYPEDPLPWDHIDIGVSRKYLQDEWDKAVSGSFTPDCRQGECQGCGVCDFKNISPRVYTKEAMKTVSPAFHPGGGPQEYVRLQLTYSKEGAARYLGHLEFGNLVLRAFRRAGISVKYSEGFHPKPKISFQDPLPLGMEGLNEVLYATVGINQSPGEILKRLNNQMPLGVCFKKTEVYNPQKSAVQARTSTYGTSLANGVFDKEILAGFNAAESFILKRKNKKGKETLTDLKKHVVAVCIVAPGCLDISVCETEGKTIRPADFLRAVFGMDEDLLKTVRIIKY